jgi:nucleotide-binding universal stress UspA family protein
MLKECKEEELMRTLLAIDGSDHSYDAVRALSHMTRSDAVILLHVLDVPAPAYPLMVPELARDLYTSQERAMREEGARVLQMATSLLPLEAERLSKVIEVGEPLDVILSIAKQERIDLIVVGARGVGALREWMLGSVSHRVVTHAATSVLVVGTPLRAVQHMVVAVERPEEASAAVRFLEQRPFKEVGDITVLTVIPYAHPAWPVGAVIPEPWQKELLAGATRFAEDMATKLMGMGCRTKGVAVEGAPAFEILKTAATMQADLIIMGSRHRGLSRVMMGSVSHTVLHRAACPVLIVR